MQPIVSATDYVVMERPSLRWLIPQYIPYPGFILLVGAPKSGKSFLALQVALSVARGLTFVGETVQSAPVLYLQFDTSELVWRERLATLQQHNITLPPNLFFLNPALQPSAVNITQPDTYRLLAAAIAAANPALVVVDVWRECHSSDEQDSTAMKQVGDALMSLVAGRSLLLLHHTHKLNTDYNNGPAKPPDPINAARGSSYLTGKADAIWLLHKNELMIRARFGRSHNLSVKQVPSGLWQFSER